MCVVVLIRCLMRSRAVCVLYGCMACCLCLCCCLCVCLVCVCECNGGDLCLFVIHCVMLYDVSVLWGGVGASH